MADLSWISALINQGGGGGSGGDASRRRGEGARIACGT
jgi:hypothetical protein